MSEHLCALDYKRGARCRVSLQNRHDRCRGARFDLLPMRDRGLVQTEASGDADR